MSTWPQWPPANPPSTPWIGPGVGQAVDSVMVEELGLLLHDGRELAVLVAGDMAVSEAVADLVVDEHLPVRVNRVTVGLGALRPAVRVDHHALGGGRVARHVVLGRVQPGLGAPLGGGAGAGQRDHEVGLAGGDPLEGTGAVVGP